MLCMTQTLSIITNLPDQFLFLKVSTLGKFIFRSLQEGSKGRGMRKLTEQGTWFHYMEMEEKRLFMGKRKSRGLKTNELTKEQLKYQQISGKFSPRTQQ